MLAAPTRMLWRILAGVLLVLPVVLLVNAMVMLRELEQARGSFLRSKAAEIAARLEQVPPERLAEEEPVLLGLRTYGSADAGAEPMVRPLLDGQELFRFEEGDREAFRAWVLYHWNSEARVARIDLNPGAADFLTARPRRNLYLAMAVLVVMSGLMGYALWARRQQEHLARMAELGRMSATLAHEIRNPLGALKGFLQLAQERTAGDTRGWLDTALDQTARLERLVRDLLLYSRTPKPSLRRVSWAEIAARLGPHAPRARFQGSDFAMNTDPDLLEQVMLNLLRNALEAGNEVKVIAEPGRIQVVDDGPGLAPEVRTRLFQPFVTTKAQGTGLGLATVRNITRALGLRLALIDVAPVGTCAEIRWDKKN
jgi:signal transduction histidine kinase